MRRLRTLGLDDLVVLIGGVAVGNAISVGLFVLLGLSEVPADAGTVGLVGSFIAVVVGFTVVPAASILFLAYFSSRVY